MINSGSISPDPQPMAQRIVRSLAYTWDWLTAPAATILDRERQAALQASESNYRLLLEQASDGIFITDPQGNFLIVNSRGREMLGGSTGDLLQRNIRDSLLSAE
jgi:PAS domain-containing protein